MAVSSVHDVFGRTAEYSVTVGVAIQCVTSEASADVVFAALAQYGVAALPPTQLVAAGLAFNRTATTEAADSVASIGTNEILEL